MPTLGYVHHSGRFDRTPTALANAVRRLALMPGVDLVACTEVQRPSRAAALQAELAAIGWDLARVGKRGEVALAYDAARFRVLDLDYPQLTEQRSWSKHGKLRAPFRALFVLLEDLDTGATYLVTAAHTPSHVQLPHGWHDNHRATEYRTGMRGMRRELRQRIKAWRPAGGVVMSLDANLDVARPWVRRYLRRAFPGMRLVQDGTYSDTHGRRTIDVVLVSRKLTPRRWWHGRRIRVVRTKDSDHRTILTRLASRLRSAVRRKGRR